MKHQEPILREISKRIDGVLVPQKCVRTLFMISYSSTTIMMLDRRWDPQELKRVVVHLQKENLLPKFIFTYWDY